MALIRTILIMFLMFLSLPIVVNAEAPDFTDNYKTLINDSDLESYWNKMGNKYREFFPDMNKESLWSIVKGNGNLSLKSWLHGALKYFFYEIIENGKLLATLMLLTIFSTLLQTIQNAFENQAVSKVAYAIIYVMLIIIALKSFQLSSTYVLDTIDMAKSFLVALIPLLLGILASLGNLVTISFFHPIIILLINSSVLIISKVVIPLFFISFILQIVSTISTEYKATKLANLIKNLAISIMGILLTVFLGVISVQGAASAIQDGIAMKTAKFVTGNFIPVIGRLFTDATDTVLSATILIKNGIGIVGVIILVAIVLFPAIKILVIAVIYKITTAILQPLGDGPVIECLDIIGRHILYLFAALLLVTFMFFFTIVILIVSSNVTMMVR